MRRTAQRASPSARRTDRPPRRSSDFVVRNRTTCGARPQTPRTGGTQNEPGRLGRHQVVERASEGPIETAKDHSLADRARNGDLDAFEELMHARIDAIYRLSFAIVGDEADARDSTQETFIAAWRRIRGLRDPDRFDAWLQRIAVNSARMTLRSRGRRRVREIPSGDVADLAADVRPSEARTIRQPMRSAPLSTDSRSTSGRSSSSTTSRATTWLASRRSSRSRSGRSNRDCTAPARRSRRRSPPRIELDDRAATGTTTASRRRSTRGSTGPRHRPSPAPSTPRSPGPARRDLTPSSASRHGISRPRLS